MIKPHLYESLPQDERRLWHSHVFEVKSGMLVMPQPSPLVPQALWEKAETAEMEEVVKLYGKVYHLWQVDRGDKLPLGEPQLMTSLTAEDQLPGLEKIMDERDKRFPGSDWRHKKEIRKGLEEPEIHPGECPGLRELVRKSEGLTPSLIRCRLHLEEELSETRRHWEMIRGSLASPNWGGNSSTCMV